MPSKIKSFFIITFVLGSLLFFSIARAGTVLNSHKYAWSDNIGYINFAGVTVIDSMLSGYAWSASKGLINFSPPLFGGVLNDGTGNLSGSAWGEQLGWIDFGGVSIDGNGKFSGTATGDLVGTITFDCPTYCDVETDWRPPSVTVSTSSSSGGGGGGGGHVILPNVNEAPKEAIIPGLPDMGSLATSNSLSNRTVSKINKDNEVVPLSNTTNEASALSAATSESDKAKAASGEPLSFPYGSMAVTLTIFTAGLVYVAIKRRRRRGRRKNGSMV